MSCRFMALTREIRVGVVVVVVVLVRFCGASTSCRLSTHRMSRRLF